MATPGGDAAPVRVWGQGGLQAWVGLTIAVAIGMPTLRDALCLSVFAALAAALLRGAGWRGGLHLIGPLLVAIGLGVLVFGVGP